MKKYRRQRWEDSCGWDPEDGNRLVYSTEVLPEDLQDFTCPMVCVGNDVVSLYPNLDIEKVAKNMKEAILSSTITWQDVDYLEAARYVALNWDKNTCLKSSLARILPRRRGSRGTRPGITGTGPRGKERGDQEQWIFPHVVLTPVEKKELIATVVTENLFKKHYYSFGGKKYHQQKGGPIGLRGTCAVARVAMQLFDVKWKEKLQKFGIFFWMLARYMDDGRIFLPPIKNGWRHVPRGLAYCKEWEIEDAHLTGEELTKRALLGTMGDIEEYL